MRVGIPHLGNVYVAIKTMAYRLGTSDNELVIPPPMTQRTLEMGVKYSPTEACLPYKLTLGSLIEACELGADTLTQARGTGICRLGYYARGQEQMLYDLGYNTHFITIDVSHHKIASILQLIKDMTNNSPWHEVIPAFFFGIGKLAALDRVENVVQKIRAVELEKGMANRIYREVVKAIDDATSSKEVKGIAKEYIDRLNRVPRDPEADPLKVGIVGEIYVVIEPFANMDIEVELGKLGVEVERTMTLSRWIKYSLFLNYLGVDEWKEVHKLAKPYLDHDVGGDGWESVGEKVLYSQRGCDGVIHLAPFTCMPEIVAQNIMPSTREDIPVLAVTCDEQMAKQGMLTRLEAFVDLLGFRRRRRRDGR
ncbi:MAG TPA: CoA protein activase [Dehalococcoidia bacterium]|nr:CoA protein activase [Dehalococcoidia bacterium]